MALGFTMPLPEEDRVLHSRDKYRDELAGLLGGRVAEEIVFNDVTTGAANDLERVTRLARKMVTELGMSDRLGPLQFGQKDELIFLGREIGEQRNYSEEVAQEIDAEVRHFVEEAHERARAILVTYRHKLDEIARRLITEETIDATEFQAMFA
jgi:cell division protease FtsH